jgi:sulfate transport system ATP-binding protein
MSVAGNIGYGMRMRGATRDAIARRVEELLALMQLQGYAARSVVQLSGGQRQRVALARALAIEPTVLLLDEPFGALDAKVRRELRSWLREIHDRTGHTTVFVTHDQEEALELADRVVVMNQGCIEQVGAPDAIYDRPTSPFVFEFIGESSSLPVRIDEGQVWFEDRPIGLRADGADEGPATLHFRPHDVQLLDGCGGCLAGTIVSSRRVAGVRRIEISVGAHGARAEIEAPADHPGVARGRVAFRPTRWRLFPQPAKEDDAGIAASADARQILAPTGT